MNSAFEVTIFDRIANFESAVSAFLYERETENSLIIGLISTIATRSDQSGLAMVEVRSAGNTVAVGFHTGQGIVLSRGPNAAFALVADEVAEFDIPCVTGPGQTAHWFAKAWCKRRGCKVGSVTQLRIYELEEVIAPCTVEGSIRVALESDFDLVTRWVAEFHHDVHPAKPFDEAQAREVARRVIDEARLYLWQTAEGLVSMAALNRPTQNTITVNAVYTPPEYRRRGYASAVVAGVSRIGLGRGFRCCVLYTDLANPTSNSIYIKLGYRPVCNARTVWFEY